MAGADSAFAARFWSFLAGPFFAGVCPRKKLICPFSASISSGRSSWIFPYAPSYPGERSTFPARRRRIPSATQGPATRSMSSGAISRRMGNSGPSCRSMDSYCAATLLPVADKPVEPAITSGRGARLSNGFAPGARASSSRSASCSTRCCTPMVSLRPQTGHIPP